MSNRFEARGSCKGDKGRCREVLHRIITLHKIYYHGFIGEWNALAQAEAETDPPAERPTTRRAHGGTCKDVSRMESLSAIRDTPFLRRLS